MHGGKPSDEELRQRLTPLQYKVTQHEGTEAPFREPENVTTREDRSLLMLRTRSALVRPTRTSVTSSTTGRSPPVSATA